jgi:hypothetical protein
MTKRALNLWLGSLAVVGVAFLSIFLYTVLHEGGHALAVLLFGGEVTRFDVNYLMGAPSISYIGVTRPIHRALISLAGPVFPLLLLPLIGALLPRTKSMILRSALFSLLVGLLLTIVSSIAIALISGSGRVLQQEDIAKFISYSGAHPLAVAGAFLLLLVISIAYLLRVGRVLELLRELRRSLDLATPITQHALWVKIVIALVVLVIGVVAMSNSVIRTPSKDGVEYSTEVAIGFSGSSQIYTFQVQEPTTYHFRYNLNTDSEVTLRLTNLEGASFVYNNQPSMIMYQGSENVQQAYFTGFTLLEGNYALELLTSGQGTLKMQIGTTQPDVLHMQDLDLLAQINAGTFTAQSYQAPGYKLIYHQEIQPGTDQLLITLPGTRKQKQASVFVVGDYQEIEVNYDADGERRTLLNGFFRVTMGYGLPAHKSVGEFRVTAVEPAAELYLFIYEED